MSLGSLVRGRRGRLFSALRLARLDTDQLDALLLLARSVSRENVEVRRLPTVDPTAVISPLASLRFAENLEIGPNVAIGPFCAVWGGFEQKTRILASAMLGPGVVVVAGNHRIDGPGHVRDLGFDESEAVVGEGSWIGANTTIVGCRIGAGAVVAANSVVVEDVPVEAVVAGAPARVVRRRRISAGQ